MGSGDKMFCHKAFLHSNIRVHFLEGSSSTSSIDKDFFSLVVSSITFTRRLKSKVQMRVVLISKHFYLGHTQQNAMAS